MTDYISARLTERCAFVLPVMLKNAGVDNIGRGQFTTRDALLDGRATMV